MLIVISPAKSLDYDAPLATKRSTQPRLLEHSRQLVEMMVGKSPADLRTLMGISDDLAELNHQRFLDWELPFTPEMARQAVLAFNGDVYLGLDAPGSFTTRDFTHAQKTLRILSGLYGVLRPLDLMAPYRLEMGTRLTTDRGENLPEFWRPHLTDLLNEDVEAAPGSALLVNLASIEYFAAVETDRLRARVVTPRFLESKPGAEPQVIAFFAKRARGAMAGWIIRNRVTSALALHRFDLDGYRHSPERSTRDQPVFGWMRRLSTASSQ